MRRIIAVSMTLLAALLVSACDEDKEVDTSTPVTVDIEFADGKVTPNGDRVDVAVGQPIDLEVTADEPGQIHVHSNPEQTFDFTEGEQTFKMQIDAPGLVEVESHDLDKIIVQLEVR